MSRHSPSAALIAWLVSLPSCDNGRSRRDSVVLRDSAGIEVVANRPLPNDRVGCFKTDAEPAVVIGMAGGDSRSELYNVRGVRRMADGRIVVLNAGTHELRLYDSVGGFLTSLTRRGSGPGEVLEPSALVIAPGDTILVGDYGTARITAFAPDGRLARTVSLSAVPSAPVVTLVGVLSDGGFVMRLGGGYRPGAQSGVHRGSMVFIRLSATGALLDTLGVFPDAEALVSGSAQSVTVTTPLFGRWTEVRVAANGVYVADNARFRLMQYTGDGALRRVITLDERPRSVTVADLNATRQARLADARDANWSRQLARMFDQATIPETLPAFSRFLISTSGDLWVRAYPVVSDPNPMWTVFGSTGRAVCRVRLPAGMSVSEIGDDYVLGVTRDDWGTERVLSYRLRKQNR